MPTSRENSSFAQMPQFIGRDQRRKRPLERYHDHLLLTIVLGCPIHNLPERIPVERGNAEEHTRVLAMPYSYLRLRNSALEALGFFGRPSETYVGSNLQAPQLVACHGRRQSSRRP